MVSPKGMSVHALGIYPVIIDHETEKVCKKYPEHTVYDETFTNVRTSKLNISFMLIMKMIAIRTAFLVLSFLS